MTVANFAQQVNAITQVKVNEPMSLHTTFRIGGPADFYAVAGDVDQMKKLYCLAQEYEMPFFLLGTGSNILVSDLGTRGLVVENRARDFHVITDGSSQGGDNAAVMLHVESGFLLAHLARETAKMGLEGLEWAVGIPGTLGGGIVYNAGAYGGCIGNVLRSVRVIKTNGHIRKAEISELSMGYRTSVFSETRSGTKNNPIILTAEICLNETDKSALVERMAKYAEHRRRTQPRGPSAV